jgi:probable rRNA maturation factor
VTNKSVHRATTLSLDLQWADDIDQDDWPLSRPRIRRLILASLPSACRSAEITIRVVGRKEGKSLNTAYRGKAYATNILTFPYDAPPQIRADFVLCLPVILAEAKQQRKSLDHHCAHLLVHGTLHACGLDHEESSAADAMEALETAILRRFRIPNPYLAT